MFQKKARKNIKNIDKIVTWVIIWWAVASIFGISKTKKGQAIKEQTTKKSRGWFVLIWKILVATLRIFSKKKK